MSRDPWAAYKKRRDLEIRRGTWRGWVDATAARRRVQALAYQGWSLTVQAERLGLDRMTITQIAGNRTRIYHATDRAIAALYDDLWDLAPPTADQYAACSVTRSRREARARSWAPPMAWDDDTISDPSARPVGVRQEAAA